MTKANVKTFFVVVAGVLAATMVKNKVSAVRRVTGS